MTKGHTRGAVADGSLGVRPTPAVGIDSEPFYCDFLILEPLLRRSSQGTCCG